jgi:hypothetical protein
VTYVFKHVFENMLELSVSFTSAVEHFVAHSGPKMSYAKKPLGDEFFIASHSLLFERGVSTHDLTIHHWEGIPALFKTGQKSNVPYDIFAASFFFLSRYEELLPKIKTENGHFDPTESLALQEGFLDQPLVDLWASKLHKIMQAHFTEIKPLRTIAPKKEVLIDVPLAFKFRNRSILVAIETFLKSIWTLNVVNIFVQFMVLLRLEEDPYDSFAYWKNWFGKTALKPKVFFLFAKSSAYETTISTLNSSLQLRMKKTGDDYPLGLLLSVQSQLKPEFTLSREKKDFQNLTHRQVKMCRIPLNFRSLSKVYSDLVEFEFAEDYSMGYLEKMGFRASTATPFYFYDLANEFQLPLKVHPIFASPKAILNEKNPQVMGYLDRVFQNLPLPCCRLTIAVNNGFLHPQKQHLPLQEAFKDFIQ